MIELKHKNKTVKIYPKKIVIEEGEYSSTEEIPKDIPFYDFLSTALEFFEHAVRRDRGTSKN